jgi:DNA repair exonuclease SbcCD nuclease subunit
VHGQGFARPDVTEDIARRYPVPVAGMFNVGLLHTSLDGRPGHYTYAPTSVATLVDRGYDYWALGHVHRREELHRDPPIVYPGNLQGRWASETGPKGATLVTVEGGRATKVEHRALDVVRWERCVVDATDAATPDEILVRCRAGLEAALAKADERLLAVRLVLAGPTRADGALRADPGRWGDELHQIANDLGEGALWIERIEQATQVPLDLDAVARRDDAVGHLVTSFRRIAASDGELLELARDLDELRSKLTEAIRVDPGLAFDDPEVLRAALEDTMRTLVPRLVGGGGR